MKIKTNHQIMIINRRGFTYASVICFLVLSVALHGCSSKGNEPPEAEYQKHFEKGTSYFNSGNYKEAIKEFEQAVKIKPSSPDAHYMLGLSYNDKGWTSYRKNHNDYTFNLLINKLQPKTPHDDLWFTKELHEYIGKAIDQHRKVLELNPTHVEARYLIATNFFNQKRYDDAIKEYEIIIKQDPSHLNSYHLLAQSYFKKGRYDLSEQYFKKALSIDPNDDSAFYGLAIVYLNNDRGKEAYKILQHLKEINSSFSETLKDKIYGGNRSEF